MGADYSFYVKFIAIYLCPHFVWVYHFSLGRSGATGFGLTVVAPKFSGTLTLSQTGVADFALPLLKLHQNFSLSYISEKSTKMSQ